MKLTRFALLFSLLGAPPAALGDEPLADNNAALQYWQGSSMLGESTKKFLEDIENVNFAKQDLSAMLADNNPALVFLHAGADMPRCEWGIDFRHGPETLMPHLHMSRELARLAVLRARYRFENGRHKDGVDDVLATFELAKDVGDTPVLISILVRYNIEQLAVDTLARELPKMDRAALDHLTKALEPLPAEDSLRRVWPQESKYFIDWALERMDKIEKESGGDAEKWSQGVLSLALFEREDAAELRRMGVPPPAEFRQMLVSIKGLLTELGNATDLPPAEQDARLAELQKPFKSNPVTKLLVPEQNKIFMSRRRWQTRHAMLDAAVAVARNGEAALKEKRYADPFGEGPFAYRKTDTGFELQSKLTFEGKPVTLTVGQAKP
jgi:hypothetical protein